MPNNDIHSGTHSFPPEVALLGSTPTLSANPDHHLLQETTALRLNNYNPELDSPIPAAGKDVRYLHPNRPQDGVSHWKVLVWTRKSGQWRGRWKWVKGKEIYNTDELERRRNNAIRAWNAADIPIEIFLKLVECFTQFRLSDQRELEKAIESGDWGDVYTLWSKIHNSSLSVVGLGRFALVCRAWYALAAPLLYSRLKVEDYNFRQMSLDVRPSTAQYAWQADIRGPQHFVNSTQVARLLSGVVWLEWQGVHDPPSRAPYHPSHALVYSQVHSVFTNVIHFDLQYCHFLSPVDLMRLLASFPNLVHVTLFSVSFSSMALKSTFARPKASRIRRICARHHSNVPELVAALAHCFTWYHSPLSLLPRATGCAWLSHFDMLVSYEIYKLISPNDTANSTIFLDPTDDRRTCTRHRFHVYSMCILTTCNVRYRCCVVRPHGHPH